MRDYVSAGKVVSAFHAGHRFVRLILGPVGSSKSSACTMDMFTKALQQKPGPDGIRRTRWLIVRNTYRELRDTTLATFLYWLGWTGKMNYGDMIFYMKVNDVEAEFLFRALDRPDDVKKVLSLEITGAWVNEAREIARGIVNAIEDRVGRYPSVDDGGCTWRGIIMDSNMPDEDHWFYKLFEEESLHIKGKKYGYYKQPGGLIESNGEFFPNPKSENLSHLESGYYQTRAEGKNPDYVRVYYCAQYGFVREGKPVIPEYNDEIHCAKTILEPIPDLPIYVGMDFGLTPAAALAQLTANGQWHIFHEVVTEDMGAVKFAEIFKRDVSTKFPNHKFHSMWGDPSGDQRAQTDEDTVFRILNAAGIPVMPAHSNDDLLRREALAAPFKRMVDGHPGVLLSPACKWLRKGLNGGYNYRRVKVSGDERFHDKPDKNMYSHICEALGYLFLGAGEGRTLLRTETNRIRPKIAPVSYGRSKQRASLSGMR